MIVVGPGSPATTRTNLAKGLEARRQPGAPVLTVPETRALRPFDACVRLAWAATGTADPLTEEILQSISRLTYIYTINPEGPDRAAWAAALGPALHTPTDAPSMVNLLERVEGRRNEGAAAEPDRRLTMTRRQATRVDPLTPEQRRVNMSRIRSRDTRPEFLIRQGLHARGLRFRLHDRTLPGTPDLVFAGPRAVIFVHGCFWHGHDCALGVRPKYNAAFWSEKIDRNRARDEAAIDRLQALGWRSAIAWECALRGRQRLALDEVLERSKTFVRSDASHLVLQGG